MATLKEEAQAYEPKQVFNIADLATVPIDVQIFEKESVNKEGKPFQFKCAIINGKEYRVADSVLQELKKILKLRPTVTKVKVNITGTGMSTRYDVEALD